MIALTQYFITLTHITFLVTSCKSTIDSLFNVDSSLVTYCVIVVTLFTLMSWVRNLAHFSFTFMLGNLLVVITMIFVTIKAAGKLSVQTEPAPGIEFLNSEGWLNTLGVTVYCFEGIGVVMPIMATTEKPERFNEMLVYAYVTLIVVWVIFCEVCYFAWGSSMTEPIITEMLPSDQIAVILIKFVFSLNLLCSYGILIYPANIVIEQWICGCFRKDSNTLYWAQNFSRCMVVISGAILGVCLSSKLDKFLGLVGSLFCAPLAMTFPAVLYLKHLAKTKSEKALGIFIFVISIIIFFSCSIQTLMAW